MIYMLVIRFGVPVQTEQSKIMNRLAKKGYQTDFIFDHDNDRIGLEITEIINGITTIADGLKAQMERH